MGAVADRVFAATKAREIEALLHDLRTVCRPVFDGKSRIVYQAKQLGLFDNSVLPAELEVARTVRLLAMAKRFVIARDEGDGRSFLVRMRSGDELTIELCAEPARR